MHVVLHPYRHGLNAGSSKSCETFPKDMVNGRLSTYVHSVVLRRANLYAFLGHHAVTD